MKKLTIEQKAQAYDEALERMKSWARGEHPECFTEAQKAAEFVFPELKESEDEKIRNFISNELACLRATDGKGSDRYEELTNAITWLKKQGKQANFRSKIQVGDRVTRNKDGMLVNLSQLKRVAKPTEKQSEQNPTNTIEPKFKVEKGKWHVCIKDLLDNYANKAFRKGDIYLSTQDGSLIPSNSNVPYEVICSDTYFRDWTIQDAKDGDVLQLGMCTVIFKKLLDLNAWCYCSYTEKDGFDAVTDNDHIYGTGNASPATKEQRDTLFAKMKEAGYEWDAENKELKKIVDEEQIKKNLQDNSFRRMFEQKPTEWSEEDEEYLNFAISTMKTLQVKCTENEIKRHSNSQAAPYYAKIIYWLKSLKERVQPKQEWKPTEEQRNAICYAAGYVFREHPEITEILKGLLNDIEWAK